MDFKTVAMPTPGPWNAAIGSEAAYPQKGNVYAGAHIVAAISETWPDAEANARLIAASPRLLEALEAICAELEDRYDVDEPEPGHRKEYPFSGVGELLRIGKAAIAEAKGR